MTDENQTKPGSDTEGHGYRYGGADAERAEGNDQDEGHTFKGADAEDPAGDDSTEGHYFRGGADAERAEGNDQDEGHTFKGADAEDETEGHVADIGGRPGAAAARVAGFLVGSVALANRKAALIDAWAESVPDQMACTSSSNASRSRCRWGASVAMS